MKKKSCTNSSLPALILTFALLIFWQAAAMGVNAAYILPSPIQILQKLWELREPLFMAHLPATMSVVAIGLVISIVLGLGLAVLMDANDTARRALYPLIIASQTIPTTALAPLFVLWFGYSIWGKVLVTVLITFFPITITVFDGFQSVKTEMEELLFTFGASSAQIFWKLKVPAAYMISEVFSNLIRPVQHHFPTMRLELPIVGHTCVITQNSRIRDVYQHIVITLHIYLGSTCKSGIQ